MEIKVGDKVRVRKNIPKDYVSGSDHLFTEVENTVVNVTDSRAIIRVYGNHFLSIPTKYLIKVEEEKKEPKFKCGDKVKVNLPRSIRHNRIGTVVFAYASGNAVNVDFGDDDGLVYCDCGCLEPYTEPTEQTEAEKKPNVGSIKIPVEVDLTDGFWDAYTADVAKEIALKVANRYNDPEEAAEYAVKVAKSVVAELRKGGGK